MVLMKSFSFSICVFALHLSPQYLGIYLLYLQGKVHMCSLCKGALADLGLHVQSGERCRCKSTQSKLKVKPQRVQRTEETA